MLVSALGACAVEPGRHVESTVTAFHQLTPGAIQGKKLAVVAYQAERQQTLEFATYRKVLEGRLAQRGFVIVATPREADAVAYVSYGIDSGTTQTDMVAVPQFGQTGGGTTYHTGSVRSPTGGFASYSGTSYAMPTFGVTGYTAQAVTSERFARHLAIDVVDRASLDQGAPVRLYEGRLVSRGSCPSFAGVFDALVEAMFQDWPGESGRARTIDVAWAGRC